MEGLFLRAKKEKSRIRRVFWLAVLAAGYAMEHQLLVVCACCATVVEILVMTCNRRGYFRIGQNRICARYHWFGKLDCSLDEVAFAYAQNMTLNVLRKDGKRYAIGWLLNAAELSNEIQRHILSMEQDSPDALREQLQRTHERRRREILWVVAGCGMMFVNILLTVWMTGSRELTAFTRQDWILFVIMASIEVGTIGATFALACRSGRYLLDLACLRHRLQGAAVMTQTLPSNHVKAVYTDPDFNGRLVVCGIPNDGSLYYIVQEFEDDFRLAMTETSRFFEDEAELMDELSSDLIDITGWFPR